MINPSIDTPLTRWAAVAFQPPWVTGSGTQVPPPRSPGAPGEVMPSDDELLARTLAFSGTYVSDDGNVTIRRSAAGTFEYSGDRFVGNCVACARALTLPSVGEPLADAPAALRFVSTHNHGGVD